MLKFKGFLVISQDEIEVDVGMVWPFGKKAKKDPA
jgi:hypothetical protein